MSARLLSSTGLGSGNLIERAQFSPAPALDKNRSPSKVAHSFYLSTMSCDVVRETEARNPEKKIKVTKCDSKETFRVGPKVTKKCLKTD